MRLRHMQTENASSQGNNVNNTNNAAPKTGIVFNVFLGVTGLFVGLLGAVTVSILTGAHLGGVQEMRIATFFILNQKDFAEADLDGDQQIAPNEMTAYAEKAFQAFFAKPGEFPYISTLDTNKDGQVNKAEWEKFYGKGSAKASSKRQWVLNQLLYSVHKADQEGNQDGKAAFAEMLKIGCAEVEEPEEEQSSATGG